MPTSSPALAWPEMFLRISSVGRGRSAALTVSSRLSLAGGGALPVVRPSLAISRSSRFSQKALGLRDMGACSAWEHVPFHDTDSSVKGSHALLMQANRTHYIHGHFMVHTGAAFWSGLCASVQLLILTCATASAFGSVTASLSCPLRDGGTCVLVILQMHYAIGEAGCGASTTTFLQFGAQDTHLGCLQR